MALTSMRQKDSRTSSEERQVWVHDLSEWERVRGTMFLVCSHTKGLEAPPPASVARTFAALSSRKTMNFTQNLVRKLINITINFINGRSFLTYRTLQPVQWEDVQAWFVQERWIQFFKKPYFIYYSVTK